MTKLTIIGAGSAVFTKNIVSDLLLMKEFQDIEIALMDINNERLQISTNIIKIISEKINANPKITVHSDQKEALKNADFVQTTIQVGGYKPSTVIDFEIPQKYGLQQTIADTLGIGGIMRGLRSIPVLNVIARDIMDICPDSVWLQYVNPMCMNMIAITKTFPEIKTVGLCHSVQGTAEMLAADLGENINDIEFDCAGINHLAFYTRLEKKLDNGNLEDLYPRLKELGKNILNDNSLSSRSQKLVNYSGKVLHEKVRYEILNRFNYFVTESSEHFAEYVPWFIKNGRSDLIDNYKIPLNEYLDRCEIADQQWSEFKKDISSIRNESITKTHEYASDIIKAVIYNEPMIINGNVLNNNFIENLPNDCCVEIPCIIDKKGITPKKVGKIPMHLAALMQTNINVQILTAEAALTKKKDTIYHAALLDPHTSSVLSIDEIYNMTDELLEAHKDYLPLYN